MILIICNGRRLKKTAETTIQRFLKEHSPQPHEATYYLEIRDAEFEKKMKYREFRQ